MRRCITCCSFQFFFVYSNSGDQPPQPTILFKSNRHHRGSIYCVAWSAGGDIIATGSNDKSIKMTRFDAETCSVAWPGLELTIHNGTVRDLAFVSRASGTPVLVSGGAGTCHYCYYYLKSGSSHTIKPGPMLSLQFNT